MADAAGLWQPSGVSTDTVKQLDDFLLANHTRLAAERVLDTDGWLGLLRSRYPEPSFFAFAARRDWRAAFDAVAQIPMVRTPIDAVFVPVWICEQQEESTNDEWLPETMLVAADGKHQRFEGHVAGTRVFAARIERAHRGYVAPSRSYARDVPHVLYNAHHIVFTSEGAERVLSVHGSVEAPARKRPTEELGPWTSGAEAAVDLSAIDEIWPSVAGSAGEGYRVSAPRPPWAALVEDALASERGGPPDEEADEVP